MSSHDPHASHSGLPVPGESVGGYVIVRQVGQGGMAVVFEARHVSLGKRVAIKMLLPHHAARADIARRFVREGEAAAKLNHPHAVDVTDVGKDARGAPYLVMEFLDGEDLAALLDREGKLSVEQAVDILVPVISAIGAAHDLGIVHRDLKPQNVFLARRRQEVTPKVVDFGISKIEAESMKLTNTEALLGTPYYMSPEQAQGGSNVDARTDQFAIGVMLYECVTGKRPFDGGSLYSVLAQIIHGTPTPPSELVSLPDPAFETVLTRALHKDPAKRYPDVRAFGAALLELSSFRTRLSYGPDFGVPADPRERSASRPSAPIATAARLPSTPARPPDDSSAGARLPSGIGTPRVDDGDARPIMQRSRGVIMLGAGLLLLGLGYWTYRLADQTPALTSGEAPSAPARERGKPPPELPVPPAEYVVALTVTPSEATIRLDAEPPVTGTLHRKLRADGTGHELELSAAGYETQRLHFVDRAPPSSITLVAVPAKTLPASAGRSPTAAPRRALVPAGAASTSRTGPREGAQTQPPPPPTPSASAAEPVVEAPAPPPNAPVFPTQSPSSPPAKRYGTNGAPILR